MCRQLGAIPPYLWAPTRQLSKVSPLRESPDDLLAQLNGMAPDAPQGRLECRVAHRSNGVCGDMGCIDGHVVPLDIAKRERVPGGVISHTNANLRCVKKMA